MWSVKFEVWSAKSAVCSVRCGVSRERHGRDRMSLNYRSFMFGKLPPPACPGLCYVYPSSHEVDSMSTRPDNQEAEAPSRAYIKQVLVLQTCGSGLLGSAAIWGR